MSIRVVFPGLLTTVQDSGRLGYQKSGFSQSGVMDTRAYHLANALVGNFTDEAVLEMTVSGGTFLFLESEYIAVTGADMDFKVDGEPTAMYETVFVREGSTISFGAAKSGMRTYIAFAGGIDVPFVMNSRSTNLKCSFGGFEGRKLRYGDIIPLCRPIDEFGEISVHRIEPDDYSDKEITLRAVKGPQDDYFTPTGLETFTSAYYTVTADSDRMGCKLSGEKIECRDKVDIISDAISFGSVQIPASGQPIVMLADRQTTGGYAKIATVISTDLPLLAQACAGTRVKFEFISLHEAQRIARRDHKAFEKLLLSF